MRHPACPKQMIFGPCGGVRPTGDCEVMEGQPCVFLDMPLTLWGDAVGPEPEGGAAPLPLGQEPFIITDLHVRPRHLDSLRDVARRLQGSCAAVLVGDHGGARNDFPPSLVAGALLEEGVTPWVTLSCRDRNRVALAAECAALAELGVAGVHCVTGDWQGVAGGMGETKVFDLDGLRLVDLARRHGLTVSVAAAPAAPPVDRRAARLAEKVKAGAQLCLVNHAGGPVPVGRFVAQARDLGATIPFVPCVPFLTDPASVRMLASLPGLVLDPASLEGGDMAVAVLEAEAMLAIEGVIGVNLSGSASMASELDSAELMAELGRRIRSFGPQERSNPRG
ncbi:MAG: methylenetetrahydrofolate reductase C-terminal domain-containing protein [Actinomycetota bacterium]|nr:methylenetetrahydrofolate reductase C-terminal domain-containing protein [Actinomycetota bacterium]